MSTSVVSSKNTSFFKKEWTIIDSLEKKGLIRPAYSVANNIFNKTKNKYPVDFIKSLIYSAKYSIVLKDENPLELTKKIEKLITEKKAPISNILHSIVAELYLNYYRRKRLSLYRNKLSNSDNKKITWTTKQLLDTIKYHYLTSLNKDIITKITPVTDYQEILKEISAKNYGSTLYDLLSFRAIDYFTHYESSSLEPFEKTLTKNINYIQPFTKFKTLKLDTLPPTSLNISLFIFQSLLKFHESDMNPREFLNIEIQRIEYVKTKLTIKNADSILVNSLTSLLKNLAHEPEITKAYSIIAQIKMKNPDNYKLIVPFLKKAIETYPESKGALACQKIINQIKEKQFTLEFEKYYYPNTFIPFKISYKNIKKIYFKLIKVNLCDPSLIIYGKTKQIIDRINKAKIKEIKTWGFSPGLIKDYKQHVTILSLDKLEVGKYALISSNTKNFDPQYDALSFNSFSVSKLGIIENSTDINGTQLIIRDRQSGLPITNAIINSDFYVSRRHTPFFKDSTTQVIKTDKNGLATIKKPSQELGYFEIIVNQNNDSICFKTNSFLFFPEQSNNDTSQHSEIFTDRNLYKPVEKVFFSVLLYEKDKNDNAFISKNKDTKVQVFDKKYNLIFSKKYTSNQFGIIKGNFEIPKNTEGKIQIKVKNTRKYISISNYKKPRLYTKFYTPKNNLTITDKNIKIKGVVKSYSQLPIKRIDVKYQIQYQKSLFQNFCWIPQTIIDYKNGVVKTNEKGTFTINFKPINGNCNYLIKTFITDKNGNTTKKDTIFYLGKKETLTNLNIEFKDFIKSFKNNKALVSVTDEKNKLIESSLILTIWPLKADQNYFINWLWLDNMDTFYVNKKEFYSLFPNTPYKKNNEIKNYTKKRAVITKEIKTNNNKKTNFENILKLLNVGDYVIKFRSDKYNIEKEKFFKVYNKKQKKNSYPELFWTKVIKDTVKVKNTVNILYGSAKKDFRLLIEIEHNNKLIFKKWKKLSNNQKTLSFNVKKEYQGNLKFNFIAFSNGRLINKSHLINVPFTTKKLNIVATPEKKIYQPGDTCKINFKVINNFTQKPTKANITLSVYDQSLDPLISEHELKFFPYFTYYSSRAWNIKNYGSSYSQNRQSIWHKNLLIPQKKITQLNWFNYFETYNTYHPPDYQLMEAFNQKVSSSSNPYGSLEKNNTNVNNKTIKNKPLFLSTIKKKDVNNWRSNFKSLAHFSSSLITNKKGKGKISFILPENITTWNITGFGHTENLKIGMFKNKIITEKKLMIEPNLPDFLVKQDIAFLKTKIINNSPYKQSIKFKIEVLSNPHDSLGEVKKSNFFLTANTDTTIYKDVIISRNIDNIEVKISAESNNYQDGFKKIIPVRDNKKIIDSPFFFSINDDKEHTFIHTDLMNNGDKKINKQLKFEYYSNPILLSFRTLLENYDPNKDINSSSADRIANQLFNASCINYIIKEYPYVSSLISDSFNIKGSETKKEYNHKMSQSPWKKIHKNIDINSIIQPKSLNRDIDNLIRVLMSYQNNNGGFKWFKSLNQNIYTTSEIVSILGFMIKHKVLNPKQKNLKRITHSLNHIDNYFSNIYENLKNKKSSYNFQQTVEMAFARSFFTNYPLPKTAHYDFFYKNYKNKWQKYGLHHQAMIAQILKNSEDTITYKKIINSLLSKSIIEKNKMFWKLQKLHYIWSENPIILQTLIINLLEEESSKYQEELKKMKQWLLYQKNIQKWENSKFTNLAVLALFKSKSFNTQISKKNTVVINIGENNSNISKKEQALYFEKKWNGKKISKNKAIIKIKQSQNTLSWGSLNWQYSEKIKNIKSRNNSPFEISKTLYIETYTDTGIIYQPLNKKTKLKLGDRILNHISIKSKEYMNFVAVQDSRNPALEPENYISKSEIIDNNLHTFKSIKPEKIIYYFQKLPKGQYNIQYYTTVTQEGFFSLNNTKIESYYAPEFNSITSGSSINSIP